MVKLTEKKVLDLMREEWNHKLERLDKGLCEFMRVQDDGDKKGIIGIDTKVRHKGSQLLYTVYETGPRDVSLQTTTGKVFTITDKEFEAEYELA